MLWVDHGRRASVSDHLGRPEDASKRRHVWRIPFPFAEERFSTERLGPFLRRFASTAPPSRPAEAVELPSEPKGPDPPAVRRVGRLGFMW